MKATEQVQNTRRRAGEGRLSPYAVRLRPFAFRLSPFAFEVLRGFGESLLWAALIVFVAALMSGAIPTPDAACAVAVAVAWRAPFVRRIGALVMAALVASALGGGEVAALLGALAIGALAASTARVRVEKRWTRAHMDYSARFVIGYLLGAWVFGVVGWLARGPVVVHVVGACGVLALIYGAVRLGEWLVRKLEDFAARPRMSVSAS